MSDWSACISDLGLAVKLDLGETPEAHGQVSYMIQLAEWKGDD